MLPPDLDSSSDLNQRAGSKIETFVACEITVHKKSWSPNTKVILLSSVFPKQTFPCRASPRSPSSHLRSLLSNAQKAAGSASCSELCLIPDTNQFKQLAGATVSSPSVIVQLVRGIEYLGSTCLQKRRRSPSPSKWVMLLQQYLGPPPPRPRRLCPQSLERRLPPRHTSDLVQVRFHAQVEPLPAVAVKVIANFSHRMLHMSPSPKEMRRGPSRMSSLQQPVCQMRVQKTGVVGKRKREEDPEGAHQEQDQTDQDERETCAESRSGLYFPSSFDGS